MHKIPSNNRTLRTAHKEHGRAATHPEKGHGCLGEQRRLLYAGLWRKSSTSSARFRVTHMATASSATPQLPSSTSVTRPNSVLGNNNVQSFTQAQKRSSNRNRSACRREGRPRGAPSPSAAATSAPPQRPDTGNCLQAAVPSSLRLCSWNTSEL